MQLEITPSVSGAVRISFSIKGTMVTTRSGDKGNPPPAEVDFEGHVGKHDLDAEEKKMPPAKQMRRASNGGGRRARSFKKEESREEGEAQKAHESSPKAEPEILEQGLIYFYSRPRVEVEEPRGVDEIARSYFILRPVEDVSKGVKGDGRSRLCIVPKKALPTSGRERWTAFVDKGNRPYSELTDEGLSGKEYETKTKGTRHVAGALAVGEGVYTFTKTKKASSLVYMLTEPKQVGQVQQELGLKDKGYFTISTRNPVYPAPKSAGPPGKPEYPREIMDDFQSLRWIPTEPSHLDYDNTQILMIGHSSGINEAFEAEHTKREKAKLEEEGGRVKREDSDDIADALRHQIEDDEAADALSSLETYAHSLPQVETSFRV